MLGFVERDAHRLHASRREESRQLNVYLVHRYISAEHPHVMRASFVVGKRTGGVIGNAQTANGLMYLPAVESDKLHEPPLLSLRVPQSGDDESLVSHSPHQSQHGFDLPSFGYLARHRPSLKITSIDVTTLHDKQVDVQKNHLN